MVSVGGRGKMLQGYLLAYASYTFVWMKCWIIHIIMSLLNSIVRYIMLKVYACSRENKCLALYTDHNFNHNLQCAGFSADAERKGLVWSPHPCISVRKIYWSLIVFSQKMKGFVWCLALCNSSCSQVYTRHLYRPTLTWHSHTGV